MQTATQSSLQQQLDQVKIVAILRGDYRGAWLDIGAALVESGIGAIEVTFNSPDALAGIKALADRYGTQAAIGAGTVQTPEEVEQAVEVGARYMVAPNTNANVIERCLKLGVLAVPGAFTPTEIEYAYRLGAGIVKLFPAMPLGPSYLKNIRGPLPHIPIMVTGGVEIDKITDFLNAGANGIGMGSPLVGSKVLESGGFDALRERASRIAKIVSDWKQSK